MTAHRTKTVAPHIDDFTLGELTTGHPEELVSRAELSSVSFTDYEAPHLDLTGASLDGVLFEDVKVDRAVLTGASFTETVFSRIDVPTVSASRSRFVDVTVNGRIGSFDASNAYLRSVHFVGCKLSFVNLHGAELLDVTFSDCSIDDLDLVSSSVRRVSFEHTRVGNLSVQHSTLQDFDLREADLHGIAGLDHLRGATVSTHQLVLLAPLMAAQFGLKIED